MTEYRCHEIDLDPAGQGIEDVLAASCLREFAASSYFTSPGWISTWLLELPPGCRVYRVEKVVNETVVGMVYLGLRSIVRSRFFRVKQLLVNTSGHAEYDNLWIEYNEFLGSGWAGSDLPQFLRSLPLKWDEVCLPGLCLESFPGNRLATLEGQFKFIEEEAATSPYVNLDRVRKVGSDYLSLLSRNTRSQIRRSMRALERIGPLIVDLASEGDEAFAIFREMKELHQTAWTGRGQPGVFASPLFVQFHERLIRDRFEDGELQLLRVRAGKETVGCLYSFVWHGQVYFYQSGFNYDLGKNIQPGLVAHVLAVEANADLGHQAYDFLAGDARYKSSLATDERRMSWGKIQNRSWKLTLERRMRELVAILPGAASCVC